MLGPAQIKSSDNDAKKNGCILFPRRGKLILPRVNGATEEAKIIVDIKLGGGCSGSEMKLLGFFRFGGAKNES